MTPSDYSQDPLIGAANPSATPPIPPFSPITVEFRSEAACSTLTSPIPPHLNHTDIGDVVPPAPTPLIQSPSVPTWTPADHPTVLHDYLSVLDHERQKGHDMYRFRLNKTPFVFPQPEPVSLVKASFKMASNSREFICYPLRVYGVDLAQSRLEDVVEIVLGMARHYKWGDILMISAQEELDGTMTIDLGFRFIDDALCMWALDGCSSNGSTWSIRPALGVIGKSYIVNKLEDPRPLPERLRRLSIYMEMEGRLSHCNHHRLEQMRAFVRALEPNATSTTLFFDTSVPLWRHWDEFLLDFDDFLLTFAPLDPPRCRQLYSPLALPNHWTELSGSLTEYQATPFVKPDDKPASKTKRWHAKRDAKGSEMGSRSLGQAGRRTRHYAKLRHAAWTCDCLPLPGVPTKPTINVSSRPAGGALKEDLLLLWDWYDECSNIIEEALAAFEVDVPDEYPPLDAPEAVRECYCLRQSLLAAQRCFSTPARLHGLYGSTYTDIIAAITQRFL